MKRNVINYTFCITNFHKELEYIISNYLDELIKMVSST